MKNFITNLMDIAKSPLSILTLIAVVILIFVFIKIKKVKITTKILVQIALAVALSTVLSFIKFYHSCNLIFKAIEYNVFRQNGRKII